MKKHSCVDSGEAKLSSIILLFFYLRIYIFIVCRIWRTLRATFFFNKLPYSARAPRGPSIYLFSGGLPQAKEDAEGPFIHLIFQRTALKRNAKRILIFFSPTGEGLSKARADSTIVWLRYIYMAKDLHYVLHARMQLMARFCSRSSTWCACMQILHLWWHADIWLAPSLTCSNVHAF